MLRIDPKYIAQVRCCTCKEDLYPVLQNAIELEHATIPPYLTAYYSIKPGLNDEIANLIRSVVIEEMLHMTIAANILVSLGGAPAINNPGFIPSYPGPLPMGIGGRDFTVHISALSMAVVKDTFMVIEEPEDPIDVGVLGDDDAQASDEGGDFRTIGEFYDAIKKKLRELPPRDFCHADRQVVDIFRERFFPVRNAKTACAGIDLIIRQGEGSATQPFDEPGELAHFYRFGEIYYGSTLIQEQDGDYVYGGDPIAFVSDGVFPMKTDPHPAQFAENTYGRTLTDNFIEGYSSLLNALHRSFNGEPARINDALGLMYQLRFLAQKLMSTPLSPCRTETGGPVYQYRSA